MLGGEQCVAPADHLFLQLFVQSALQRRTFFPAGQVAHLAGIFPVVIQQPGPVEIAYVGMPNGPDAPPGLAPVFRKGRDAHDIGGFVARKVLASHRRRVIPALAGAGGGYSGQAE